MLRLRAAAAGGAELDQPLHIKYNYNTSIIIYQLQYIINVAAAGGADGVLDQPLHPPLRPQEPRRQEYTGESTIIIIII